MGPSGMRISSTQKSSLNNRSAPIVHHEYKMLDWNLDRQEIICKLSNNKSLLKIILKTKNDPEMLTEWIPHHFKNLRPSSIIIIDNGSDNPDCLNFYRRSPHGIIIFRYNGFHNNIHDTVIFDDLYKSLESSARFYTALDTDERLVFFGEDERLLPDRRAIENFF
jgi:hypothetical protein